MRGRLNLFQATMLQWRGLHPYNAVHVMTVEGPVDPERLRRAIAETLESWGLTGLVLDQRRDQYEYTGGPSAFELATLDPVPDAQAALAREIERQLNRPFPATGPLEPFRFFTLAEPESFQLGLAYDHLVAAGDSIVMLLKAIGDRYATGRNPRSEPVERYPARCAKVLAANAPAVLRGTRWFRAMIASCRRSVRPRYRNAADGTNGFRYFCLGPEETRLLKRTAKQWDVTLNDLLLALTLVAVEPLVGPRDPDKRRHEIGVASIMNIRGDFGPGAAKAFGQFLSSFRVSHPMPPGVELQTVARDLRAQTAQIKRKKLYLQSLLAMAFSRTLWRVLDDERRAVVHAKSYPTWAGVSNLDVNAIWRTEGGGTPPRYVRAVPTGPLTPVVLAVTSAQDVAHFGVSFRTSAVSESEIAIMSGLLIDNVRRLAS